MKRNYDCSMRMQIDYQKEQVSMLYGVLKVKIDNACVVCGTRDAVNDLIGGFSFSDQEEVFNDFP